MKSQVHGKVAPGGFMVYHDISRYLVTAFSSGFSLKLRGLYLLCHIVLAKVCKWVSTLSINSENQ